MVSKQRIFDGTLKELILEKKLSQLSFEAALQHYCQKLAQTVDVQRVGVWSLDQSQTSLTSLTEWNAETLTEKSGTILTQAEARTFIAAISRHDLVVCDDALSAPECTELAQRYLPRNHITSLLACPLHRYGQFVGVLCLEHIGPPRTWEEDESEFVACVASLISAVFSMSIHALPAPHAMALNRRARYYAESVSDWYWETDAEYRLQNVIGGDSKSGLDMQALIGLTLWEVQNLAPVANTWPQVQASMERRSDIEAFIVTSIDPSGAHLYGELTGKAVFADDGTFIGYSGIARDATSRIQRDMELRSSETKYLNAAHLANVGSWVWDELEGRITYCSPELELIYGTNTDELIARTVAHKRDDQSDNLHYEKDLSWIHPDDREEYRATVESASRNRTGYDIVTRIIRDDGSVRILHERCEPVFDLMGRFVETTGVLLDITAQEESKNELMRNRAQLSNLMDNIPGAIYRVKNDRNWTIIYKSAGFDALFVPAPDRDSDTPPLNLDLRSMIAESDVRMIDEAVAKAIENDSVFAFEYPVKKSDGSIVWLSERGRPVIAENGDVELEGFLIDVTEKHEAEEALVRAQRLEAIGQLTGGVAHDFNNLLAVILGNLELLRDELSDPDHLEFIQASIGATWRGADLTKNMLSFARRARLQPALLDLNKTVADTQRWISRTLPENIIIHTVTARDLWEIEADRSSSESALLNLILNARDAMPQGGKLIIETSNVVIDHDYAESQNELLEKGRYVVLSVTDTGQGMSKDVMNRIFEPFFTTKIAGAGSGLGLSMIQGFIKQSGGSVHVYSEPGVGTTFKIYFKARDQGVGVRPDQKRSVQETADFAGAKILVAEDEIQVLRIIKRTLEGLGCVVTTAASGDEALHLFEENPDFDLLVTDIVMPGKLMGTHLAKAARAIRSDLPVIFMSGYADEAMVHGNGLRPEDIRLSKPTARSNLIVAVKRALAIAEGSKAKNRE